MARLVTANGIGFLLPRDFSASDIAFIVNNLTDETLTEARLSCRRFVETNNWNLYAARLLDLYECIERDIRTGMWPEPRSPNKQAMAPLTAPMSDICTK
jgi:hypothetical protein